MNKLNLNNQFEILKQVVEDLNTINDVYNNYNGDLMDYSGTQISEELLRLKNNLIFNRLVNEGLIQFQTSKDTMNLVQLIDETKELINETDYAVGFDELINDSKNDSELLNQFEKKYNRIMKKVFTDNINYLELISDVKTLANEFSINLDDDFDELKKDVESNKDLINLIYELDLNNSIFNMSELELIEYTKSMDLNKEFSDLINNNIFSKGVCEFYNKDFESKLDEIDSLSLVLIDSLSSDDLSKNMHDIVDEQINSLFLDYSEIKKLIGIDLDNSKDLIMNNLLIFEKIDNILSSNIFIEDYTSKIQKEKEKLDNLIDLYELELKIQNNEKLINKHFNEILNSPPISMDRLNEKLDLDIEFTNYYHQGIFSDITIKNIKYLYDDELVLDNLISDLYFSEDYLDIYENNKFLINQINDFGSGFINQEEFIINTNTVLKDDNIEDLLKLDINSQLMDYQSTLSSLRGVKNKYFESDDIFNEIINHIKYTELIDNDLFEDEEVVKSNIINVINDLNKLNEKYYSILKDIHLINKFYDIFPFFKLNEYSFNHNLTFEILNNYLNIFKTDLNNLKDMLNINSIVKGFIKEALNYNIDKNKIKGIFNYNVYNTLLNNFYEEYPNLKDVDLDYNIYKNEIDKIDSEINKNKFNQVLADIYSNFYEFYQNEKVINQKESFNHLINDNKLGTIKTILNDFKEYILAVKPIFLMDINQFYEYISNEYESSFDYVILDKNFEFEDLDQLCIFLRSKNKLIDLR